MAEPVDDALDLLGLAGMFTSSIKCSTYIQFGKILGTISTDASLD
jgi:hypothetical protein